MNSGNVLGQPAEHVVPFEFWALSGVSDAALLDGVRSLVQSERKLTARLLAHLNEVEERRLHWQHAVNSMFAYCIHCLGMSEDEAGRRIAAARLAKQFPALYSLLDEELALDPVLPAPARVGQRDHGVIQPLSRERYKVQFTVDQAQKEKLELARDLMAHALPERELAAVIDRALDLLIAERMKQRFGTTSRPKRVDLRGSRQPAPDPTVDTEQRSARPRVTNETRRLIVERDGLGCSYVDAHGKRCGAMAQLEFDHIIPVAKGGRPTAENLRIKCRAHNRFAAELEFGREHVARAIKERPNR
jgi:hypothetical protein